MVRRLPARATQSELPDPPQGQESGNARTAWLAGTAGAAALGFWAARRRHRADRKPR